jgi:hypothetical protein
MANRNKIKGNRFELKICKELNEKGYKVGTSRLLSRYMDDNLVDICDYPDAITKFPYHIQAKSITGYPKYEDIFSSFVLTDKPLIIFHEYTRKTGKIFKKIDEYVIMKKSDFYKLI